MTIPTSEPERLQSKRIEEMPEPLRWTLRRLGEEYGPLGVALAAAEFTDKKTVANTLLVDVPRVLTRPNRWEPKGLIEQLSEQQTFAPDTFTRDSIGMLIDILALHRPTGPDGKHGNRHTPTCGCTDKPFIMHTQQEPTPTTVTIHAKDPTITHEALIKHLNS